LKRPVVGFLRQTDAASLLMAEELGGYAKHGLAPEFRRGASPMDLQERLLSGELLAAHLPAGLPVLRALQAGAVPDLVVAMVLSQNGAAITLGRELCASVKFLDLPSFRQALLRRPPAAPAVFAVPAIGGSDDLLLRYLLAAAGVPAARVQVVSTPAERMLAELREERINGFAAPDPWSALAAGQELGFTYATAQDVCLRAPRSVLATTTTALSHRRDELKSLIRAVIEASVWLDVPANRGRPLVGDVLSRRQYLDLDAGPIRSRLGSVYDLGCRVGERDFEDEMLWFHHAGRVNLPLRGDAYLYAALADRFGLTAPLDSTPARLTAVGGSVADQLYREVAGEIGVPLPEDMKPLVITLDAVRFDPGAPGQWARLWARWER
jgi:nitrate/nitrite transport system substrate-binding protein